MEMRSPTARWSLLALTGGAVLACAIGARPLGHRAAFIQDEHSLAIDGAAAQYPIAKN